MTNQRQDDDFSIPDYMAMDGQSGRAKTPGEIFGHPRGLYVLFFTEMWERFSFYGMRALLILYMLKHFFWSQEDASALMGWYAFLAYALPVLGGLVADKWLGARRTVALGALVLSAGHLLMAFEPKPAFFSALALIVVGVGLLKPNISTQVGALYKPGDHRRDGAFTIFYMGINLGALLGPWVCDWLRVNYGYHYGFAAAGVGMLLGLVVYTIGHRKLVEFNQEMSPTEPGAPAAHPPHVVRDRIIVLLVIFAFVILFWMAFEQASNVMVVWADQFTNLQLFSTSPPPVMLDGVATGKAATGWAAFQITAGATQSINPLFIIILASPLAFLWTRLDKRGVQPSTPTKMVLGIAGVSGAFLVMVPAATFENRPSSVALSMLPEGVDLSKYGATRMSYDAEGSRLMMKGVLPDLDRLRMLADTAPVEFVKAVKEVNNTVKKGEEVLVSLPSAPPGFRIVGDEAKKVLQWDAATKTLTASDTINDRARIQLLAAAANPEFKSAVDELYVKTSKFRISIWWLILHYLLTTMGELCLSPVGLSLVTKLAPPKHVGLFMGGWFLSTAVAEKLAHVFGGMWGNMTPTRYFMIFVVVCGVGALLMAILVPALKRMMHEEG